MHPSFNTCGPCVPGEHYMLPPERRLGRVLRLIDEQKIFTLHSGRQTGKTTSARWTVDHLNATGRYRALWVDLEAAREQPDPLRAFTAILDLFERTMAVRHSDLLRPSRVEIEEMLRVPETAILSYVGRLSGLDPRPLVLLLDESDGLVGAAMNSLLTQLRAGYIDRDRAPFAASVALIGQRQVRDYLLGTEQRSAVSWLGTTSPFNVTAEASTLTSFTHEDVDELLAQHTAATGQRFETAATGRIFELTQGHPWLVNAIADQIVNRDVEDRAVAVTPAHVEAAKDTIIRERRSHIDSLVARLREERVRKIIEPMLVGEATGDDVFDDDFGYVLGLGLIVERERRYEVANPIYREIIPRALTHLRQMQLQQETAWYIRGDGSLDTPKLLSAFQEFWREDGHLAADGFGYREAGPHLMLMAFLQRLVNGGGEIRREYGLGRGALDLMILWKGARYAIEVKLRRTARTEEQGIAQLGRYLAQAGLDEGWLVIFDTRPIDEEKWDERITQRDVELAERRIHVIGC